MMPGGTGRNGGRLLAKSINGSRTMSLAEHQSSRANGAGALSGLRWPSREQFDRWASAPRASIRTPRGKRIVVHTDRVRAKPAITPTLSMNIGVNAIGLGLWGTLFPGHVKKTLGVTAPAPVVQALFGVRELLTGYSLAGDPTRSEMLWARVAGDVFDLAVLNALDHPGNPKRKTVKAALGFVVLVTVLDALAAVRMTGVKRNCLEEGGRS
jgi:hypothetical protein